MSLYGGSHVGEQPSARWPISPYIAIENVQTSWDNNFSVTDPNALKFDKEA